MDNTIDIILKMSREILADSSEPGWRKEQAEKMIKKYSLESKIIKQAEATRATLKRAARVARKMGFTVRSSINKSGKVSSYYARRGANTIRISDHDLPATGRRDFMREVNGGGSPFAAEIIIDGEMTETKIKRLMILAENGRV